MHLFSLLQIRDVTLKNRIAISPMQQYCAGPDGVATDWHLVHLGSRAVGGAGLVCVEATAVSRTGRWTPYDLGLWSDEQIGPLARIATFLKEQGAATAIQIGHAGSRGSRAHPRDNWAALPPEAGGWPTVSASAVAPTDRSPVPRELTRAEIREVIEAFRQAARRAREAGFEILELHGAHGYLLHQFYSPLTNQRKDAYGGSFENRIRFTREVVAAVRSEWPANLPLFLRISATDFAEAREASWTLEDSVALCRVVRTEGVDVVVASGGGFVYQSPGQTGPGYQVPFAERLRREAGIATGAVGLITEAAQADQIIRNGQADLVMIGRESLRDPYFPLNAGRRLGLSSALPEPYLRGFT